MPSALETLVKILKLEQQNDCDGTALIGGLSGFHAFAENWARDAHTQAKKPEHHSLVDELSESIRRYAQMPDSRERAALIRHMLGRIMGRIPPPAETPTAATATAPAQTASPPERKPFPKRDLPPAGGKLAFPKQGEGQPNRPSPQNAPKEGKERKEGKDSAPHHGKPSTPQRTQGQTEARGNHGFNRIEESISFQNDDPDAPAIFANHEGSTPRSEPRLARPPRASRPPRDPQEEASFYERLSLPVIGIKGIGPKIGEKLSALGLESIRDWLYFFPRQYVDYTQLLPLRRVQPNQQVTVLGTVRSAAIIKGRRGVDVLNVTLDDGTGTITASFFGQPYLMSKFQRGTQVVFSGKTGIYLGRVTMDNPEWEPIEQEALHTRRIIPIYPLTKGLSAHSMRRLSAKVIETHTADMPDYMPLPILERLALSDLSWALRQLHAPDSWEALDHARRRAAFDDLLMLQVGMLRNRRTWQSLPGIALPVAHTWLYTISGAFPFAPTNAQKRAIDAIRADMAKPIPMNRLLQGDVGSGKTLVATVALLIAVSGRAQGAIMAPTSILAEQHYKSISRLIAGILVGIGLPEKAIRVALLTGATPAAERAAILAGLREGTIHIAIGTHALIQEGVNFARLGVAIIDEQHRFGVEQRGKLRGKGENPHLLVMTATPIPRTLAWTRYADLDLTILDELPPGRTPITTKVISPNHREYSYNFIRSQIRLGRQAFIVYPLIEADAEKGEKDLAKAAVAEYERLSQEIFPNLRLGLLHGRLSPTQKDAVMDSFNRGELDILVSTTVIEVGIDVPNANVILIEGAYRFGLAQLHQLRGRVGRGEYSGFCMLVDEETPSERLAVMEEVTDGFRLAEIDWEQRGAGELLGTRQSGRGFEMGSFMNAHVVELAQLEARTLYAEDPDLELPEHALLRAEIERIFGKAAPTDVS